MLRALWNLRLLVVAKISRKSNRGERNESSRPLCHWPCCSRLERGARRNGTKALPEKTIHPTSRGPDSYKGGPQR
jgi:hypothetical protein